VLIAFLLCLGYAVVGFGGVIPEYCAPLYGLLALLSLLWAAKLYLQRKVSWIWSPLHVPVVLFAVYAVIRYYLSPVEYESRMELMLIGSATLIYFVVACNFHRSSHRNALIWTLLALAVAQSGYALWQYVTKSDTVLMFNRAGDYYGRGSGTFYCPNNLGGFLELALGMALARLVISRSTPPSLQRTVIAKLIEGYCLVSILIGLYATQSRGAWLGATLGVVAFLLWAWRTRAIPPRVADIGIILVVALIILAVSVPTLRNRLSETLSVRLDYTFDYSIVDVRDPTMSGRAQYNQTTMRIIRDHPLFGTGPGTWQWFAPAYRPAGLQGHPEYAHNDVLQLASDYGFVGVALLASMVGCFLWMAVRLNRIAATPDQRAIALGAVAATAAILTHSLFDFSLHIPANAYVLAMLMGLVVALDNSQRKTLHQPRRWLLSVTLVCLAALSVWGGITAAFAHRYTTTANYHKDLENWDIALDYYQRALAIDRKLPEPYIRIGDIYRLEAALREEPSEKVERRQLAERSITAYRQALALNPFDVETMLRLAATYEVDERFDQAMATYQDALRIDAHNAFVFLRLGSFYEKINDSKQAIAAYEESQKLGSEDARDRLQELRHPKPPPPPDDA
jgi:O-antigen ligase